MKPAQLGSRTTAPSTRFPGWSGNVRKIVSPGRGCDFSAAPPPPTDQRPAATTEVSGAVEPAAIGVLTVLKLDQRPAV
ncbi:hypothetical protein GCM10010441_16320 [Kitasatospora paracochleata]